MKNKKLPIILLFIMLAWIVVSIVCMFLDNMFTIKYIFQGIGIGAMNDGMILFGLGMYNNLKNTLECKGKSQIKATARRNSLWIFRFLIALILISIVLSCIFIFIFKVQFTIGNVAMISLIFTVILFIVIGAFASIKSLFAAKKEYGIGIVILIIIIIGLMLFIKYQN